MRRAWWPAAGLLLSLWLTAGSPRLTGSPAAEPQRPGEGRPRLMVLLVVDQLRTDYLEKFGHHWTGGLRRLMDQGAWYRLAAFPYWNTVTCAGHATIGTGAFPVSHGMVLNAWWDRAAGAHNAEGVPNGAMMGCTDDPRAQRVSGDGNGGPGQSAWRLLLPTLADEMRSQLGGHPRVVAMSLKARSAIGMAGQRGDAVVWWDGRRFVTSSAYTSRPVPFVETYQRAHPVERDLGKVWEKVLPRHAYLYEDDMPGEWPRGHRRVFPYTIGSGPAPDNNFYGLWAMSPFSDAYLAGMAIAAVDNLKLGHGVSTDFLAVSFSALDYVGHAFGPRSHEIQDTLARLDRVLGELLDHLDRVVGRDNYVVALSSDHGVSPIPEQVREEGFDAGRLDTAAIAERLDRVLAAHLGPGRHIARLAYNDLYFAPGVYDRLRSAPGALEAVLAELRSIPGVARVFRGDELAGRPATADPLMRAAMLSYYPGRSGDLIVLNSPFWITSPTAAATHGSGYPYDTRVPVILMGPQFQPGDYYEAATPADIAPTLGHLVGVTLGAAEGRVLGESVTRAPRTPPRARP